MKRMLAFACLIALVSSPVAWTDGIRSSVTSVVTISADDVEGETVSLRYNDSVAVFYPKDALFIQGIEFELRIPKAFQGAESSIAWSVYSRVSPTPSTDRLDYTGDLIATQPLPARVSLNLVLPILDRHGIKNSPFASLIPMVAGADRFPLLFKLSPIGKGLSPSMETAEFKLTVRPVLRDEGGIKVAIAFPEGADRPSASVFVDDKRADDPQSMILAKKGARVVRVSAEGYREEVVTIAVAPGKVSLLSVSLTPNAPLLVFQAPSGTFLSLDGQAVSPADFGGLAVEPGEHTLFFRIGDYSMTRKFMALRGKVYQVVLSVELDIVAEP